MKKGFFSILGLSLFMTAATAADPVILKIGDYEYLKSEFEYIYNKNNSSKTVEKKSLDEYMDLFINYKLKVRDARRLGFDAKQTYKDEYELYEKQLAIPYMRDEEMEKELMKEAFERMKYQLLGGHILVSVKNGQDTVAAYEKINKVYEELQGGANFSDLAREYSDCPSKNKGGSLGYFSAFDMVYDFENVAYATPVGSYSKPFRTQFGYHIVKVYDKRVSAVDKRFSHILIKNDAPNYYRTADSLYALIKEGADFVKLAKKHSMDNSTASNGGDLGYLSQANYPAQIMDAVSSVTKEGGVTKAISAFGVHLIKVTEIVGYESMEKVLPELKEKLAKSDRQNKVGEAYIQGLKDKYGVSIIPGGLEPFYELLQQDYYKMDKAVFRKFTEPLYTFEGNVYSQDYFITPFDNGWMRYSSNRLGGGVSRDSKMQMTPEEYVNDMFDAFIVDKMYQRERDYLANTYPEIRNLLREYSDGLLLFEVSSQMVWDKASSDTAGLREYFENHKENYKWDAPKYKGIVVCCMDEKTMKEVNEILNANTVEWAEKTIRSTYKDRVLIHKGLFAEGANNAVDSHIFKSQKYVQINYPFITSRGGLISSPQTYEDVKGPVTADYQNYLESEWVKNLRSRWPITIYKEVLNTVK